MKLYYMPGACSIGIHVLLEEIGKPYDLQKIDGAKQEQYGPDFVKINPKSKVPTLMRDDGSVLTEFPAIATWLARKNPDKGLLPSDADGEASALEAMDYAVSTMHMQGFSRIYRPGNFAANEAEHDAVKTRGRQILATGLDVVDRALQGKDYVVGAFSIADAALFYVEFWASSRIGTALPPNCAAHFARMKARPAVVAVMKQEGLAA